MLKLKQQRIHQHYTSTFHALSHWVCIGTLYKVEASSSLRTFQHWVIFTYMLDILWLKHTHPWIVNPLQSNSYVELYGKGALKGNSQGRMETGMLRVLRAETVRSGFHSLPFSRTALKKNPKALFLVFFFYFPGVGAGVGWGYWQKSCIFCLLQMNVKETNTAWNIAFCLWPITYMHIQV